mmetsp:Transcript_21735/g.55401  ORF Transcript_21735/g.55401 Transcript_21735/m.55401 type:complete len:216 (+) Transcript_21735:291-938(+)
MPLAVSRSCALIRRQSFCGTSRFQPRLRMIRCTSISSSSSASEIAWACRPMLARRSMLACVFSLMVGWSTWAASTHRCAILDGPTLTMTSSSLTEALRSSGTLPPNTSKMSSASWPQASPGTEGGTQQPPTAASGVVLSMSWLPPLRVEFRTGPAAASGSGARLPEDWTAGGGAKAWPVAMTSFSFVGSARSSNFVARSSSELLVLLLFSSSSTQ